MLRQSLAILVLVAAVLPQSAIGEYATESLVLYMDARQPGAYPQAAWVPLIGTGGQLYDEGRSGHMPSWRSQGGDRYTFGWTSGTGGGKLGGFSGLTFPGSRVSDADFTIEIWVRPARASLLAEGRMHLFGNQKRNGTGYRLTARTRKEGGFSIEFDMRDTSREAVGFGVETAADFRLGEWHQIALTYRGSSGTPPAVTVFVNGSEKPSARFGHFDNLHEARLGSLVWPTIGLRGATSSDTADSTRHYFGGDIALVRFYRRALDGREVYRNFLNDRPWIMGAPETRGTDYVSWTEGSHREAMKRLPVDRRVTIAQDADDELYLCRADVAVTESGKLLCVFIESDNHNGERFQNIAMSESLDDGHTWADPHDRSRSYGILAYGRADQEGYRHSTPNIQTLPDGRLVISTGRARGKPPLDVPVLTLFWSEDEGRTWSEAQHVWESQGTAVDRVRQLSNGDLIVGMHNRKQPDYPETGATQEVIFRSTDGGATWMRVPQICASHRYKSWHEASFVELGEGRIVMFVGDLTRHAFPTFWCFSDDWGYNFTEPVMAPWFGQKNEAGILRSGKTFVTFRQHGGEQGYSAWLGVPLEDTTIMPVVSHAYNQKRIRLLDDRLVMESGEGSFEGVMYVLPPTSTPEDRVVFEARMRCIAAEPNACQIGIGTPIAFDPGRNRVYLKEKPAVGFEIRDLAAFHDYRIVRDSGQLQIWCDGRLRLTADVTGLITPESPMWDPRGRNISFGNYSEDLHHIRFRDNEGRSEWQRVTVEVEAHTFPSYRWSWDAESRVYPDQYIRDRQIMLELEGSNWSTDYGYGGWVQLADDSIFVVDYTRGDGVDHPVTKKPFIRGYFLYESDFD